MNSKIVLFFLVVIAVLAIIVGIMLNPESSPESKFLPITPYGFTYDDMDSLRMSLAREGFQMSSSTVISDHTIDQYCTFYDDGKQKFVPFCRTTALSDNDQKSIGNVNFGGSTDYPVMAIVLLETSELYSKTERINIILEKTIEKLVCDCWAEIQPGKFNSVSDWIDAARNHYESSGKSTLTSKIDGLEGNNLILEITQTENSYLTTLVISKVV